MFIGREKELSELNKQFKSETKSIVLVYGKRRVVCSSGFDFTDSRFDLISGSDLYS